MPSQYYGSLGPNLNIKFEMNSTKGASANIAQEILKEEQSGLEGEGNREGREGYGLLFVVGKPSVENSLSHNILILYHICI
jgi:hypothetical protein